MCPLFTILMIKWRSWNYMVATSPKKHLSKVEWSNSTCFAMVVMP